MWEMQDLFYDLCFFFGVFVHVYSFAHSFANIMGSGCFLLLIYS